MIAELLLLLMTVVIVLKAFWNMKPDPLADLPGPPRLPIIGNLHQLSLPKLVHCFETWAMDYGPVYKAYLCLRPVVVVSDINALIHIQKQRPEVFTRDATSREVLTELGFGGLFVAEGEQWRTLRPIIANCLTPKRIMEFKPCIAKHVFAMRKQFHCLCQSNMAAYDKWMSSGKCDKETASFRERIHMRVPKVPDLHPLETFASTLSLNIVSDITFSWGHDDQQGTENTREHLANLRIIFDRFPERAKFPIPYWRLITTAKDRACYQATAQVYSLISAIMSQQSSLVKDSKPSPNISSISSLGSLGSIDLAKFNNTVLQNLLNTNANISEKDIKSNMMLLMIAGFGECKQFSFRFKT
jgi:hypothetical protein